MQFDNVGKVSLAVNAAPPSVAQNLGTHTRNRHSSNDYAPGAHLGPAETQAKKTAVAAPEIVRTDSLIASLQQGATGNNVSNAPVLQMQLRVAQLQS